jgi:hypothetical protein
VADEDGWQGLVAKKFLLRGHQDTKVHKKIQISAY